ncbi:MAG TPA: Gfo/Idh/MocA family oxidoreductase [Methylomirabilota bacterium]|nr:Gfo/Idh/MocA family oxidoreductase [Methylomirabilota bacterium]
MRFIVLGAGSIGRRHLDNARALGHHVVAVFEPDPDRRTEAAAMADAGAVITGDEAVALAVAADAAIVCSPTHRHLEQARAAIARGLHVLVEKPLSHALDGTADLVAAAAAGRRTVLVGCNLRFLPSLGVIKRVLDEGRIGAPLSLRAHCGYYLPYWRPHADYRQGYGARQSMGGGIILDAIHELDYVRWLLGEPREVFCYAGKVSTLEIDTEDAADILLRFEGGVVANVHLDYLRPTYRRGCELIGGDGLVTWDYASRAVHVYGKHDRWHEVFEEPIDADRNDMYVEELRHFVECVDRGASPLLDAAGGRRVLEIALAAKASAASGRPVRLDP